MEPKKKAAPRKKTVKNVKEKVVSNGLSEAILGFNPESLGAQLSQVTTLFKNNRWYLVSNMRQLLSEIYVEHGIIQRAVNMPVDDALRGGITIKTEQLDEKDITKLQNKISRADDLMTMNYSFRWNRLFGGSGVMTVVNQDAMTPFNPLSIRQGDELHFRAVDMWELFYSRQNTSDYADEIDNPNPQNVEFYDYYGQQVHHTRVMKQTGVWAPSFIRPRLRGWGLSFMETLVRAMNQYSKATDLMFEVLDEFKVDVYKIKNLTNTLLSPVGEASVRRRVQIANQQKNYQNAITMDSEDDFAQKQLTFTGIAETLDGIRTQLASDLGMPKAKLFGEGATGFSSGEDSLENYNAMVESEVREKMKTHLIDMVGLRCQQLFGFTPDDLEIEFKPLRVLNSEQEENVKTQKFNRIFQAAQAGLVTAVEFKESANRDNLFAVKVDVTAEVVDMNAEQDEEEDDDAIENSLEYDMHAFETDGGVSQFDSWRQDQIDRLEDKAKVKQAKEQSIKAYGKEVWSFVVWKYKALGGKI